MPHTRTNYHRAVLSTVLFRMFTVVWHAEPEYMISAFIYCLPSLENMFLWQQCTKSTT